MATADVLDAPPPVLEPRDAEAVARTHYGIEAQAELLVSERDQNFRLADASGAAWVLKVSNAAEDPGVVEMEVAAVERIAEVDPALPVPVARPARDGSTITRAGGRGTTPPRPPPATATGPQRGACRSSTPRVDRAHRRGGRPHRSCAARLLPSCRRPNDLVGPEAPARARSPRRGRRGARPAGAPGGGHGPLRRAMSSRRSRPCARS